MFNFSSKPGHGISKEEAQKRDYFGIFGRHFGHIVGANFWYLLTNALFFIAAFIFFRAYFVGENGNNLVLVASNILTGKNFIVPFVPFIPFMLIGPFTAGYTYVIRNYAKQEPTFLISDFFEHSKRNLKQSLIVSVLSVLVGYLLTQAFVFYNNFFFVNNLPLGVLYTLTALVFAIYIIMMFYVYPLMVTFKMNLKVILKNSWTFTILKLPQNIILFVLLFGIDFGLFYLMYFVWYLPGIFYFVLFAFFLLGFTAFTANYYIWHVMDKYIVSYVTQKKNTDAVFNDDEYPDFDDDYNEEFSVEDEYLL